MGEKVNCQKGNSPTHFLRSLNALKKESAAAAANVSCRRRPSGGFKYFTTWLSECKKVLDISQPLNWLGSSHFLMIA